MACTRKKQCLYGDICPTARSNEYNLIDASCYKPLERTNEEWFCSLSTEEKAKWIAEEKMCRGYFIFPSMEEAIQDALAWLKEKHHE